MNTVEQFITNTIDTYVTPIIEEFRNRGRGKGNNAVNNAGAETAQKVGGRSSTWSRVFWAVIVFVCLAIIAGVTNYMKFWSVQGTTDFIKSIPSRVTGTYVPPSARQDGGLSEVAAVSDISVTQA